MKKFLFLTALIFMAAEVAGQEYDLSKYYPKYEGYRSYNYYQDTVRYLKYNWGLGAAGVYGEKQLSAFFDKFELSIYAVELYFSVWEQPRLVAIDFYLVPPKQFEEEKNAGFDIGKYLVFVMAEFRQLGKPDRRLTYDELSPYFPGLNKEGKTLYLWKESYKEILGKCWVEDIQYNFEITGEPF